MIEALETRSLMTLSGDTLFPADNPWNQRVAAAPIAGNSSTLVASIGASRSLHPDFGTIYEGAYIGIPFMVVSAGQPLVDVVIDAYADESDIVPVPIPAGALIEGDPLPSEDNDGDRHLIVYDKDSNIAYELYNVHRPSETDDGRWHADSEAIWHMDQNWFRNPNDTSADAAGLPILPGLVRPDEVLDQGAINHALRFTVPNSRNSYVFPASHQAGSNNDSLPRMGERFRLKQSFDISGFSPANRVILQALKDYGMIVADNGSGWYLSGQPSSRWNDDDLHNLESIVGNNFEAVDLRPNVSSLDQTTGNTAGGTSVTIHGLNFSGAAGRLTVNFGTTPAASVTIVSDSVAVATAPAHAAGTVDVRVLTPYGTSAIVTGDRFTYTAGAASTVASRYLFYNGSTWDGGSAAANAADDGAIATDKATYRPGAGIAGFANVSSYSKGINGLMVDLSAGGAHASITAADFVFKVGNSNVPSGWAAAPAPSAVVVRPGAGAGGSDRVEITWADNAIRNTWLEVQVRATAATGLAAADVFFWGNRVGDVGANSPNGTFLTSAADATSVLAGMAGGVSITDSRDFNRDGNVTAADKTIVLGNQGAITRINIGAGGPFSPVADEELAAVASALPLVQPREVTPLGRTERSGVSGDESQRDSRLPSAATADNPRDRALIAVWSEWSKNDLTEDDLEVDADPWFVG